MLEDLIQERLRKIEKLKARGFDPYPPSVQQTRGIGAAISSFDRLSEEKATVALAGRVTGLRKQGGVLFADLKDESGKFQLVLKQDELADFDLLNEALDLGDFAEAAGTLFTTARGEKSLAVSSLRIIAKSLRPIPSDWYGLKDTETRLRERYLDLLLHPETKELFVKKGVFWNEIRAFLRKQGFLEVETPVLESIPGGADAEPFKTHHNALDSDFYLRISLEIALKKLLVAGYENVFEIGRIFRNEGIDAEHLQDYTQLEFYSAYHDYKWLMKFVRKLYQTVIKKTFGTLETKWREHTINWATKWPTLDYYKVFKEHTGLDLKKTAADKLRAKAEADGLKPEAGWGRGRLIDALFKKARKTIIQPAFLINPPADIEPLAKRSIKDPNRVERMQVIACGTELGKGFSEANDPVDQRARFEEQMRLREKGDREAQMLDEEFLTALEYGMPPAAGFGVSERLFAVLVDKPVREAVFFPLMRPRKE